MKPAKKTKKVTRTKAPALLEQDHTPETFVQDELKGAPKEKKKKVLVAAAGDRTFYLIVGAVVVIITVFILAGMFLKDRTPVTLDDYHDLNLRGKLDPEEGYIYNGFSFVKVRDTWYTRLKRENTGQPYHIEVRYGPRDIEDVPLTGDYTYLLTFNTTFITFDPTGKDFPHVALAAADISTNLARVFNITPFAACSKNETAVCASRPIVQCKQGTPVIFIREDPVPAVVAKGTCITVQGSGFDLVKAANRLLFAWYGIM